MSDAVDPPRIPGKSNAGAGLAGAGGGTLLLVIAQSLPEHSVVKPLLIYSAPAVSAVLSIVWLWAQAEIANYLLDRKVRSLARAAKRALEEALGNTNTSAEHHNHIKARLEELELIITERHIRRIRTLEPMSIGDIRRATEKLQRGSSAGKQAEGMSE